MTISHDEVSIIVAVINGAVAVVTAWFTRKNRKDIDGVAEVVGTVKAKARKEKMNGRDPSS